MSHKWLFVVCFLSIMLTLITTNHQLTNAAPDVAPHMSGLTPTPSWHVVAGGGGKDVQLNDVSMISPAEGWLVGAVDYLGNSMLMRFDGTQWTSATPPEGTYNLIAVNMVSSTEGWAVGENLCNTCDSGVILHYTAGGWQRVAPPTYPGLSGIWSSFSDVAIKGATGWIVGGDSYFLKFNGTTKPVASPDGAFSISIVDANEAWAASTGSDMFHYANSSWTSVSPGYTLSAGYYPHPYSVHMLNSTEGWAVGEALNSAKVYKCLILHYASDSWVQVACPLDTARLTSVQMRSATDGWAVGQLADGSGGVILHYDGAAWTSVPIPPGTPSLASVNLTGTNEGWIVGAKGTILHLVNGAWARVQGSSLVTGGPIDSVSANEVWFSGSPGQLVRWKGGAISTYASPITTTISALDMVSPTLGWAGTWSKPYKVVRYSNGTWTTWPVSSGVYAISMVRSDEGWFATSSGVSHLAGGLFESQLFPSALGASSISMLDSNHGWAVQWSEVMTYTDGTWANVTPPLDLPGDSHVTKIIGVSPAEAWVVGYSVACDTSGCPVTPELQHFSGGTWTNMITPTNQLSDDWLAFFDISKVSATEWWAAGRLKTLEYATLHYQTGSYTTVPAAGEDVKTVSMQPDGTGFASGVSSLLWLHSYPYPIYLPLLSR